MADITQEQQECLDRGEVAHRLLTNPDMEELLHILEKQKQQRLMILLQSTGVRGPGIATDEFLKGAIYGLALTRETLEHMLSDSRELREILAGEEDDEDAS